MTIRPRPGDLEAASKPHPFVPSGREYAVWEPCGLCGFSKGHRLMHPDEAAMRELPEDRWPTPTEWLAWLDSLDRTQRLEVAGRVIEAGQAQNRCVRMNHEGCAEEVYHLRQRVIDLTLALHDTPTAEG